MNKMKDKQPQCALCPYKWPERFCRKGQGKAPDHCPSLRHRDLAGKAMEALQSSDTFEFARQASIQEAEGYGDRHLGYDAVRPIKPRILEIMEFAKRMKYRRLALVFCVGLRREAKTVLEFFKQHKFDMISVVCKVGSVPKEILGLVEDQKIVPHSFESMCHPVLQAFIANHYEAEFNILLGLCVGHDSLFFKHANAPCTVLAVKDRLLGHNPLAAIYQYDSYYRHLKSTSLSAPERGEKAT
jgi:uncharacterized metal-binding protein